MELPLNTENSTPPQTTTDGQQVNPTTSNVTPEATMLAVVDLHKQNENQTDQRNKLCARILLHVWPKVKFLNFDTPLGKKVKKYIQKELGLTNSPHTFEIGWPGIKQDVYNILRNQRAYAMQQVKPRYFGE